MKAAIIICLILSMPTFNWTDTYGVKHNVDIRLLFTIAALVLFLIRG